ncbi:MAG: hypothetical protein FJ290_02795 [Planctomycetes bacterium]|nr:hypothetical protein [Planctomycetota bacterium]
MRKPTVVLCLVACSSVAFAEHVLRTYPWEKVMAGGAPKGAQLATDGPGRAYDRLKVENPASEPLTVTVLTIHAPPITWARYAVAGFVRHERVEGKAYLEMWNHFPNGGAYFSATLAEAGPMRHLEGTADWRPFTLPFSNEEGAPPPAKLVINVVLPGRGTVVLSGLRLAQYRPDEDPVEAAAYRTAWWGERMGGFIGGGLGGFIGLVGALVGVLAGRGKARRFVLAAMAAAIVLGVGLAALGVAAVAMGQPYAVYYPLVLAGGLSAVIPAFMLPRVRKRYEELELRRIQAADAR